MHVLHQLAERLLLPRIFMRSLAVALILSMSWSSSSALDQDALSQLLLDRRCDACDLRSADLVHADLLELGCVKHASEGQRVRRLWMVLISLLLICVTHLSGASLRGADLRSASSRALIFVQQTNLVG